MSESALDKASAERSGPSLVQRLRSIILGGEESEVGLRKWFNQFAMDLEAKRRELTGSLEKFSKEFAEENATVKATFRSQVSQRVDQFRKEVEAELQKRRITLEEDFAEFTKRMNETWKNAEAQFLSELQEERVHAKDAFLTETEQERSRIKTELSKSQNQRALCLREEADGFSKALIDRQNDVYRALETKLEQLQDSLTQALESASVNLQQRFSSESESKLNAAEDRFKEHLSQIEEKLKSGIEAYVSSVTRHLEKKKAQIDDIEQRLDEKEAALSNMEQELEKRIAKAKMELKEADERHKLLMTRLKHVDSITEEGFAALEKDAAQMLENAKANLKATLQVDHLAEQARTEIVETVKSVTKDFDERLKKLTVELEEKCHELKEGLDAQLGQLNVRKDSLAKEAGKRLDETNRILEQEVKKFSEKFKATLQAGLKKISERLEAKMEASLEDEFNKVLDEQLNALKACAKTETYIKEIDTRLTGEVEKLSKDFEEKTTAIKMTLDTQTSALRSRVFGLQNEALKLMEERTTALKTQFDRINEKMQSVAGKMEEEMTNAIQRFRDTLTAQENAKLAEVKAEFDALEAKVRRRSEEVRTQLQQRQPIPTREMSTQPAPAVQTETAKQPVDLATFTFSRDGNYVTVRQPPELPVVVLLARTGEFYCGGCAKTDCIHTQAVRQWLKAEER